MDEYGCDPDYIPEPRKMVTALLAHPIHGRLVERVMLMVSNCICYQGCFYTLSWRDRDVCFYQPAFAEACCLC